MLDLGAGGDTTAAIPLKDTLRRIKPNHEAGEPNPREEADTIPNSPKPRPLFRALRPVL